MVDFLHKAVGQGLAEIIIIIGLFPSNPNICRRNVWLFWTAILWIRFLEDSAFEPPKNPISFLPFWKWRRQKSPRMSVQVEKYGGYVPNYRARGEQHYRVPYKDPNHADWGGQVRYTDIHTCGWWKNSRRNLFFGLPCQQKSEG